MAEDPKHSHMRLVAVEGVIAELFRLLGRRSVGIR